MNVTTDEFMTLSQKLSDRDVKIAELTQLVSFQAEQLAEKERENAWLREEVERQKEAAATSKMQAMYLKSYIMLSVERIKSFMRRLKDIDRWAFLRTFVFWSLPAELEEQEKALAEEVMALPDEQPVMSVDAKQVVMNNNGRVTLQEG